MGALQTIVGERRIYSDTGCSHIHSFAQLILPLTGTLFIETQAHQLNLDETSVFFLPSNCLHYFYARDINEFLVLDIPAHLVSHLVSEDTVHGIRVNLEERWRAIQLLLLAELKSKSPQTGALLHLVNYISNLLILPNRPRSIAYIHQHFHCPLDVARLAQIEGYSFSYYSEWFKTRTGKSPKAYIQDLRLQHAKELLQQTDLPIYAIARHVGFEQASSLIRLFQQRNGLTPQLYRLNTRNSVN